MDNFVGKMPTILVAGVPIPKHYVTKWYKLRLFKIHMSYNVHSYINAQSHQPYQCSVSPASLVMIFSWLSYYPGKVELFKIKDHLNTHGCQTGSRMINCLAIV